MPKNIENEQTNLFNDLPVKNPNKKGGNMNEQKVSPLEMVRSRLMIEYIAEQTTGNNNSQPTKIIEQRRIKKQIEELKKRLLKILDNDQAKLNEEIRKIREKAREISQQRPPDPYQTNKESNGAPFCEKCQHFHWPQEPCSDWQD